MDELWYVWYVPMGHYLRFLQIPTQSQTHYFLETQPFYH